MYKENSEKSAAHIALQPKDLTKGTVQEIMLLDLCNKRPGEIAELVGLTLGRVSIIRGSPLYRQQLASRRAELKDAIIEKKSDSIVNDPVHQILQEKKVAAIEKLVEKMAGASNEFLQVGCAKDILDRAGYAAEKKVTTKTIEVTEKMAGRFEEAIKYTETRTRGVRTESPPQLSDTQIEVPK